MEKYGFEINRDGDNYDQFLKSIQDTFNEKTKNRAPILTVSTDGLFEKFLSGFKEGEVRQHYNCNACHRFVNKYGGLVTLDENGKITSLVWDEKNVPEFFKESVKLMKKDVESKSVKDVFFTDVATLGEPITGCWHHMSLKLPRERVNTNRLKNADQIRAEKHEDFKMLVSAINSYKYETVEKAVNILKGGDIYRSDNCIAIAEWLKGIYDRRNATRFSRIKENILWQAVATAPVGFCHVKSGMIGTVLDDISDNLSFNSIKSKFEEKMRPSNYMRSQSAPSQGNINQAEKIVEKLGLTESLERRYAKFDEIPEFIWKPKTSKTNKPSTGVFSNVKAKGSSVSTPETIVPTATMTFDKFMRTVMPDADSIEVMIDNPNRFMALLSASNEEAPSIINWDNNFSWYYHGGIDGEIKRRVEQAGGRYENNKIRCSLLWNNYTDLDLHCHFPKGHIYHGNRTVYDGWLDVDKNVCPETSEPVENIRWSNSATVPNGIYTFTVNCYTNRSNDGKNYFKVELEVDGQIYIYNGNTSRYDSNVTAFSFEYRDGKIVRFISSNNNVYSSASSYWNLPANSFVKVNGITMSPNMWGGNPKSHVGQHYFFILDGCKDVSDSKGRGFFNEMLKPELREVRKTLEAYCANSVIQDADNSTACGVGYNKDSDWNVTLKVTNGNNSRIIKIDRFD